jgi:hypothetical protein
LNTLQSDPTGGGDEIFLHPVEATVEEASADNVNSNNIDNDSRKQQQDVWL